LAVAPAATWIWRSATARTPRRPRAPGFITEHSEGLEVKAQWKPLGVTG
jgi:hypothetical protein